MPQLNEGLAEVLPDVLLTGVFSSKREAKFMSVSTFIQRQIAQIRQYGYPVVARKLKYVLSVLLMLPLHIPAVPVVLMLRLIRPWLLVRCGRLNSGAIGHFAGNTELYLCERDAGINLPKQRHVDLFYMPKPICNNQLAAMWKRVLHVWPVWILAPISRVNRLIPGGAVHEIGNNTQADRDVHNLLDRLPSHLQFTADEEARGKSGLRDMGIPPDTRFVCLNVRDSAYRSFFTPGGDFSYHNYRDSDIQNYVPAAEELANRGYFVIRTGAKVNEAMKTNHPRVIDYAFNGMRSDFMDIYLGAKCEFCISTGTGWDDVPEMCRRPIVFVNYLPVGYFLTHRKEFIYLTKHHIGKEGRELTLEEIFSRGVGFSLSTSDYESKGVQLMENTPEEIRDVVIEMVERLNGAWQPHDDDEDLQRLFWEIFPADAINVQNGRPLHGEVRARFGAAFLRNNRDWLK
ncbi:MAG: TIGR04372 family glycosyltransferase [Nitrospirae bacterium]|nr:TIGR04372 family glycosyltransferase [Nitrospirota bacterium]